MVVVIDTNIIVSALRSGAGPCHAIIDAIPSSKFTPAMSIPLYLEYLDVLNRPNLIPTFYTSHDKLLVCDQITAHANKHDIHYLWRNVLPDPKDDMILELAVAAEARYIVTRNLKDFGPAKFFGIEAILPAAFIQLIGGLP